MPHPGPRDHGAHPGADYPQPDLRAPVQDIRDCVQCGDQDHHPVWQLWVSSYSDQQHDNVNIPINIDVPQRPPVQNNFPPRFPLLPGLLSRLRWMKQEMYFLTFSHQFHQIWAGVSSQACSSEHLLHHLDRDQGVHHHLGRHRGDHHHLPQQANHNKLCQDNNNGEIDDCYICRCINPYLLQVVTDIHVSRSPVTFGWMSSARAEKVQKDMLWALQTFL